MSLIRDSNATKFVASAATDLLGLPKYVLAMFRAASTHFYAAEDGGNM